MRRLIQIIGLVALSTGPALAEDTPRAGPADQRVKFVEYQETQVYRIVGTFRSDASKNTIAPVSGRETGDAGQPALARTPNDPSAPARQTNGRAGEHSLPNDRAADSQMRVMEAVIRRTLFNDPEAVGRVMTVARQQLDAHIAAGRTIQPAVVRDASATIQRGPERSSGSAPATPVRQTRDHKPPERNRSR